jgi:hypothetical protein
VQILPAVDDDSFDGDRILVQRYDFQVTPALRGRGVQVPALVGHPERGLGRRDVTGNQIDSVRYSRLEPGNHEYTVWMLAMASHPPSTKSSAIIVTSFLIADFLPQSYHKYV